ncbi:MAG: hypothetical protein JF564_02255 [Sphingomonas sp.]|nr:hypothetical protein [Sphingomonas sp.]
MAYDRYAGIKSLPGDPLNPETIRPFIVNEHGDVIYQDEPRDLAKLLDDEKPIQLAELGNLDWNGYEVLRAQGQRDGQALKKIYDRAVPAKGPNAVPPASRYYPIPSGAKEWAGDHQNRFSLDKDGKLMENPAYKRAYDAVGTNAVGVAFDLGKIAAGTAAPLRAGAMSLGAAQRMVGVGAAKEGYHLTKGRGSRKGSR